MKAGIYIGGILDAKMHHLLYVWQGVVQQSYKLQNYYSMLICQGYMLCWLILNCTEQDMLLEFTPPWKLPTSQRAVLLGIVRLYNTLNPE